MQGINIINLVALAVVCLGIYHGVMVLAKKLKEENAKKQAAAQSLNVLLGDLAKAIEVGVKAQVAMEMRLAAEADRFAKSLDSASNMQEKILTGTTKACESIAVTTEKHRQTVASLGKMIFGAEAGKDALTQPSEQARDILHAEMAYRAQGNSPEEARALAEAEIERENSLPNSL